MTTATDLAEVMLDMLTYAARDARDLANAARQHVADVLLAENAVGSAMDVATAADKLGCKLSAMIAEVSPSLAEFVIMEVEDDCRH